MLELTAKLRDTNKNVADLRKEELLPGVIYGYQTDNLLIQMEATEFEKIHSEAGESTLIKINLEDQEGKRLKKTPTVLIQETQEHPVSDDFIHVDFYQPDLKKKVEVEIPIEFTGVSLAVKEEEGTLVKNITSVTIEALPESLIHEIKVDISVLETFDDVIKIKDLEVPDDVTVKDDGESVVALVSRPRDIDEELKEPIDEELEDVEVIGEKEVDEEEGEEVAEEKEEKEEKKEEKNPTDEK